MINYPLLKCILCERHLSHDKLSINDYRFNCISCIYGKNYDKVQISFDTQFQTTNSYYVIFGEDSNFLIRNIEKDLKSRLYRKNIPNTSLPNDIFHVRNYWRKLVSVPYIEYSNLTLGKLETIINFI